MTDKTTTESGPAPTPALTRWFAASTPFLAILILLLVLGTGTRPVPALGLWLGRFHVVVLHFPIALLALALLLETCRLPVFRWFLPQAPTSVIALVLGLGALSAWGAALCGWLLALRGDYNPVLTNRHFYAGLATTVAALLAFVFRMTGSAPRRPRLRALYALLLLLANAGVLLTGHVGGTLTHGQNYLTEFTPWPFRSLLGLPPVSTHPVATSANTPVFASQLLPALQAKCVECHGELKSKGKLRLDSYSALMQGGGNGPVVKPGKPEESELMRRIELSPEADDFMPPQGKPPLTESEVTLLRSWIQSGASETATEQK